VQLKVAASLKNIKMVLPQALEYNWEFNRSLEQIGEAARQRALLQRKLEFEDQEKTQQVVNMISPDALNKNYSRDVVNAMMPQAIELTKTLTKGNVPSGQAREKVYTMLADMTEYTNKDKSLDEGITSRVKGLDNSIYDVGRIEALARDMAKFNTVNGQKVLKSKDEMDPSQDYVSLAIEKYPDLVVDERKATNAFQAAVKAIPEVKKGKEVTYDKSGRRVSEKDVEELSFLYTRDANNNIVLKKKDGFVPEDTFQVFYNQYKPWIDGNAKRIMRQLGVPESPDATEWFKRSFLTNTLERNASGTVDISKSNLTKDKGTTVNVKTGGGTPYVDAYALLAEKLDTGKVNELQPLISDALIKIANKQGKRAQLKGKVEYSAKDFDIRRDKDNKIKMYEKGKSEVIATIDPTDFNTQYNKEQFGSTAAGNASGIDWKK
jgi:hypothetical protein